MYHRGWLGDVANASQEGYAAPFCVSTPWARSCRSAYSAWTSTNGKCLRLKHVLTGLGNGVGSAASALHSLQHLNACVHLELQQGPRHSAEDCTASDQDPVQRAVYSFLHAAATTPGSAGKELLPARPPSTFNFFTCVEHLTLSAGAVGSSHMVLSSLVPHYLIECFPKMRTLTLQAVSVQVCGSKPQRCTQLQALIMRHVQLAGHASAEWIEGQLLALPGLTALELIDADGTWQELSLPQALRSQLTSLRLPGSSRQATDGQGVLGKLLSESATYTRLRHLCVPHGLDLSLVNLLLDGAPNLQHLQAPFIKVRPQTQSSQLQHILASKACTWEKLTLHEVHVESLAMLPFLATVKQLSMTGDTIHMVPIDVYGKDRALELTTEAVAVVQGCGGLWPAPAAPAAAPGILHLSFTVPELFMATLPLTSCLRGRTCCVTNHSHYHLSAACLTALDHMLAPDVLIFSTQCFREGVPQFYWSDGVFPSILKLLPGVRALGLKYQSIIPSLEDLLELCKWADRPVTVRISTGLQDRPRRGWAQKVPLGLAALNHSNVTLEAHFD